MSPPAEEKYQASIRYIRAKIDQLLALMGTLPLRPEELDNDTLIELDPIGIIAESFGQVIGHLNETNYRLNLATGEIRAILDAMNAAIVVLDRAGRVNECNRQALEWFFDRAKHDDVIGRPAEEICSCKDQLAEILQAENGAQSTMLLHERHFQVVVSRILTEHGDYQKTVVMFIDITERKEAEEEIQQLAFYDHLTRLPNRRLLLDRLKHAIAANARTGREGALLFLDLDNFKNLNDILGHDKGDLLLQQVAQRLASCVREGDTVARLGGDEFVVMLEDLSENSREAATQTEIAGEKILSILNQPYQLAGHEHHTSASIGVTLFGDHRDSGDELLKRADLAMYRAKAAGRNTLRFFDPEMQAVVTARATLEADLRQGLKEEQFLLYFQPQVDIDGCVTGAEVLLRWRHPLRGLVSPLEFIPLAEETGLILPLGLWVLKTACARLKAWAAEPKMARLTLSVNVSVRQFRLPDFVEIVTAILDQTGADPQKLKLELTESLLLDDMENIVIKMTALKEHGVNFALDDFGTGYSSLSYLKRLPLDQLKIDRSFVMDVLTDPNDAAIARTIVALAQSLGLSVIAEGVETEAQRDFLANHGCHAYQGYLFGRPLPLEEFERFMNRP